MLTTFNELVKEGNITVGDKFQFGQKDGDGTGRWIVFHNKENTPFQVRNLSFTPWAVWLERGAGQVI